MHRLDCRQEGGGPRLMRVGPMFVSAALALLVAPTAAFCVNYYLATDHPAVLGGTRYRPDEIVLSESAVYSLETGLGPPIQLGAIHRAPDGSWLLTPAHPVELGGARYQARDVVTWDGGAAFAPVLDGVAEGLPRGARIDAVFVDRLTGNLVLSFDAPVEIAGVRYDMSDLVERAAPGVFVLLWDGAASGVPVRSNVVGADRESGGNLVVTFDVRTSIGAAQFQPGDLVAWDGVLFSSFFVDAAWPRAAQLRDFSFVPGAGRLEDGAIPGCVAAPAPPLDVTRNMVTGDLTLTWGPSCLTSDRDYEIYEGNLGAATTEFFYSHTAKPGFCSTGGAFAATFADPNPAGGFYWLVVPRNALREGSYGESFTGACGGERPVGILQCMPQELAVCP